jgi:carboxyl-terminal processing protease
MAGMSVEGIPFFRPSVVSAQSPLQDPALESGSGSDSARSPSAAPSATSEIDAEEADSGERNSSSRNPSSRDSSNDLLERGYKLEESRKWGEAIRFYEEGIRRFPGDAAIQQRLQVVRVHFDVDRRYRDRSYVAAVDSMSEAEALQLYNEVLANLETHYVEAPRWYDLQRHGTAFLEVALMEPHFLEHLVTKASPEQVEQFRLNIHHYTEDHPVRSRMDLPDAARQVAMIAERDIGLKRSATILEFMCGAIGLLDTYTRFLTGNQLDETFSSIEGNFVGLGIEIKAQSDRLGIESVIPGGPAEEAGLKAGDAILQIDQTVVADVDPEFAADQLRGEEGSVVKLQLFGSDSQTRTVSVRRRRVEVPSVENVHMADEGSGVGYLRLTTFQKSTRDDVDNALWKLQRQGMRWLIMDLRGNPGGLLPAAVEVADRFLSAGRIVSTRGRNIRENVEYSAHSPGTWSVPLTVLVDGDSASASEIFAGAIRDHQRGAIFGERTYGKGTVQGIFQLQTAHAGLCLTTAKFFTPSGQAISQRGVTPDHEVKPNHVVLKPAIESSDLEVGDGDAIGASDALDAVPADAVLDAAVEFARAQRRVSVRDGNNR